MKIASDSRIAEINVIYSSNENSKLKISNSEDAYSLFRNQFDHEHIEYKEFFKVVLLKRNNEVLGILNHLMGGSNGTVVDIRQIIGVACKSNSSGLILAHNHPSGNLLPSHRDRELTQRIKEYSRLTIQLFEHKQKSSAGKLSSAKPRLRCASHFSPLTSKTLAQNCKQKNRIRHKTVSCF